MSGREVSLRKFSVIGPHRPCGSIVIGRRIMFCVSRSPMTVSPRIMLWFGESSRLVLRFSLFHSKNWRCLSAPAVNVDTAFSNCSKE